MINLLIDLERAGIRLYLENGQLKSKARPDAVTAEIAAQIKQHKTQIIRFLAEQAGSQAPSDLLPRADQAILLPSYAQQRLYTLDQIQGGSAEYHMPLICRLKGHIDTALITQVCQALLRRHQVLHTVFVNTAGSVNTGGALQMRLLDPADFRLRLAPVTATQLTEQIEAEVARPFDLEQDFMLRVCYLPLAEATQPHEGVLVLTLHHVACDGWSMQLLLQEFVALYQAYQAGTTPELAPLQVQYADYAQWQRDWLQGDVLNRQLDYWQQQLAGLPVLHSIPTDRNRPEFKTPAAGLVSAQLDLQVSVRLQQLAQQLQLTPFMLIHAALALVLSRHSGSHDIVIGTPVANRRHSALENLIGFFTNTLVLRLDTRDQALASYFSAVRQVHLDALSQQDLPFEQLVEVLRVPRSSAHSPLFQIMLSLQSDYGLGHAPAQQALQLPDLQITPLSADGVSTKFELEIGVTLHDSGISMDWTYYQAIFDAPRITAMANHLCRLLQALADQPALLQQQISALPLLDVAEIRRLEQWNDNAQPYPAELCIQQLFEQQVARTPDAVALEFDGQTLSYQALNQQANQLAHYLRAEHGVGPDVLVGLCCERSFAMVVGLLGILKAGGAYVPLDPDYPPARLAYLQQDAAVRLVLSQQAVATRLGLVDAVLLDVAADDSTAPGFAAYATDNIDVTATGQQSSQLAYVIYTSGSTGQPKGVLIEHRNTVAMLYWARSAFSAAELSRVLASTSLNFDLSVFELLVPLSFGFSAVLVRNVMALAEQPVVVSMVNTVPSAMKALLEADALPPGVQVINLAGEALTAQQVNNLLARLPGVAVCNLYGPSEDTTYSTCARFTEPLQSVPDIGRVITNSQAYVLGSAQELVPVGGVGELYLGGAGLARGYLNKETLTAERFVPNPYYVAGTVNSSEWLYRTGDLVRYRADGRLEFIGRSDDQVKVRGFRIELGEIEHRLNRHPSVQTSLVLARRQAGQEPQLVAYVQPALTREMVPAPEWFAALQQDLQQDLPGYMVPALFVAVAEWPLTPNGKIDKNALPAAVAPAEEYLAPATETEQVLAEVWAGLLGLAASDISANANFFALGGHSLLLMQLSAGLKARGISIGVRALFQAGTLRAMANAAAPAPAELPVPANLITADCQRITPELLPLISLSQAEIDAIAAAVPGGMANIQDIYPLAPLQEGVLFVHSMDPAADPYVTTVSLAFADQAALLQFFQHVQQLLARHDVLRTAIFWRDRPAAVQVVLREVTLPVQWLPFSAAQLPAAFDDYVQNGAHGMDLTQAPLLQLAVTEADPAGRHYVLLKFHHLITDHVSLQLLLDELAQLEQQPDAALPPVLPYRDFIARTLAQLPKLDVAGFFSAKLGDVDTPTLPFGLAQVLGDGREIEEHSYSLSAELSAQLRAQARAQQVSPAVLFHLAFAQVLSACTGRDDVVFGTVLSGRMNGMPGIERLLGMLINTLPLRVQLGTKDAATLLQQVSADLQALLPYEQVSLAQAQRYSGLGGNGALFSAMFNYRHDSAAEANVVAPASSALQLLSSRERTNYPFELSVNDAGAAEPFSLDLQLHRSISGPRVAGYLQTALEALVAALTAGSPLPVLELPVLPAAEQQQQLQQWQSAPLDAVSAGSAASIQQRFEQQAAQTPDAVALVFGELRLSYRQLNERANQLAHYLRELHLQGQAAPQDWRIGLVAERSAAAVLGMLAILKAGAAYVPLDPASPPQRLQQLLAETAVSLVLSPGAAGLVQDVAVKVLELYTPALWQHCSSANLAVTVDTEALAYVMYTSGSTGTPKGVQIPHRAVLRLVCGQDFMPLGPQTVFLQSANLAFDAATLEIWGPLLNGGCCVVYPDAYLTPERLNEVLRSYQVNALWLTSGLFTQWSAVCAEDLPLEYVLAGGDVLSVAAVREVQRRLPKVQLLNGYGPTENTTFSCVHAIPRDDSTAAIPIGRPLRGDVVRVLSAWGALVPAGVAGELYVGGAGLARDYLAQAAQSAERFIQRTEQGETLRLYRTGDRVRYTPEGALEFVGRGDDQVKVRGFRVEPGEVVRQLELFAGVRSALVLFDAALQQLVAYVEATEVVTDGAGWIAALRQGLAAVLPGYMVPGLFVQVKDWPLTANGKVDKRALPAPDLSVLQGDYVAAQNETEQVLVALWADLLGLDATELSTSANFFTLGGHSLLLMKLLQQINQRFDLQLDLASLYHCEHIQACAAMISAVQSLRHNQDTSQSAPAALVEFEEFEL